MTSLPPVLALLASFALGSIPSGLWIGRGLRGVDVRRHGSGNLGATNVYRVLGPALGITVLLCDAGKGALAVLAARALWPDHAAAGILGLLGALLGHSFTPLAAFRGGKGVATAAGAWACLAPLACGLSVAAWAACFAATRIVSISSIAAAVILPLMVAVWGRRDRAGGAAGWVADPLLWLALVTALLVVARHHQNIARLRQGSERRLDLKRRG
jgi:glycerol-3-phosphate acyltransferase PlsY